MNRKERRALGKRGVSTGAAPAGALFAEAAAHHQAGRLTEAERRLRALLAADPRHAQALHALGVVCAQSGRPEEAAALIGRSLALEPGDPAASYNHANALSALGRDEAAIEAYRRSLAGRTGFAPGWLNLAAALARTGRAEEAAQAYGQAITLEPGQIAAHRGLADVLRTLRRPEAAAEAYRRALAIDPGDGASACNLGQALQEAGRYDEAVEAYRRALGTNLGGAQAYVALAASLRELGESADALAALDRALDLDPANARAFGLKSSLKTFSPGDADIVRMEAALARASDEEDRILLGFALGKAHLDASDGKRAFARLDAANRAARSRFAYDVDQDVRRLAAIGRAVTPGLMDRLAGAGPPSDRPVFVVGMPRSGTTLIEQILASHPDVHGAGELTLLDQAIGRVLGPDSAARGYADRGGDLSAGEVSAIGRAYLEGLEALAPPSGRVVDKLPANFRHAGLIALALPGARIVHCRRDPVDTCLSCYERRFVERVDYAYDLVELGRYHRAYQDLTARWRALLPGERFIEVDYEAVVEDLEGQARRLVEFCGLAWDEACLRFHTRRRDIRTASAAQARRPIYRSSVGRWKPFAAQLGPLLAALG